MTFAGAVAGSSLWVIALSLNSHFLLSLAELSNIKIVGPGLLKYINNKCLLLGYTKKLYNEYCLLSNIIEIEVNF